MNELREKRLLLLATTPNAWHKRFYSQYYRLINAGLVYWFVGMASLTPKGEQRLEELLQKQDQKVDNENS
jgi:hypothetical protein